MALARERTVTLADITDPDLQNLLPAALIGDPGQPGGIPAGNLFAAPGDYGLVTSTPLGFNLHPYPLLIQGGSTTLTVSGRHLEEATWSVSPARTPASPGVTITPAGSPVWNQDIVTLSFTATADAEASATATYTLIAADGAGGLAEAGFGVDYRPRADSISATTIGESPSAGIVQVTVAGHKLTGATVTMSGTAGGVSINGVAQASADGTQLPISLNVPAITVTSDTWPLHQTKTVTTHTYLPFSLTVTPQAVGSNATSTTFKLNLDDVTITHYHYENPNL
jgi:hypothetical protein